MPSSSIELGLESKVNSKNLNAQEEFWAFEFGNGYISRNESEQLFISNVDFFSKVFSGLNYEPEEILEIGANIGMNIKALQQILPRTDFTAIEINQKACEELRKTKCEVIEGSVFEIEIKKKFNFVFTKGVLIHLSPEKLIEVYDKIYTWSSRYILIAEYYNPTPVMIPYRGELEKLFKRDFAGEMLDRFPNLELRKYGFVYHRDINPQDDINWFLLEKVDIK